jgi:hypothetical protein
LILLTIALLDSCKQNEHNSGKSIDYSHKDFSGVKLVKTMPENQKEIQTSDYNFGYIDGNFIVRYIDSLSSYNQSDFTEIEFEFDNMRLYKLTEISQDEFELASNQMTIKYNYDENDYSNYNTYLNAIKNHNNTLLKQLFNTEIVKYELYDYINLKNNKKDGRAEDFTVYINVNGKQYEHSFSLDRATGFLRAIPEINALEFFIDYPRFETPSNMCYIIDNKYIIPSNGLIDYVSTEDIYVFTKHKNVPCLPNFIGNEIVFFDHQTGYSGSIMLALSKGCDENYPNSYYKEVVINRVTEKYKKKYYGQYSYQICIDVIVPVPIDNIGIETKDHNIEVEKFFAFYL